MKISKRILGVALALIMIFNVFAVGAFAAFPDDTAVKLMLSTDKATYAPGDEIVITFSEQVKSTVGQMKESGQYEIAYNSAVLAPLYTDVSLSAHGTAFTDIAGDANMTNSQYLSNDACQANGSYIDPTDATTYGWDTTFAFNIMQKNGTGFDATDAPLQLFSYKMKIAEDAADGTYTIGFNKGGYEGWFAYSVDMGNDGIYGMYSADMGYGFDTIYNYECGTATFTVSSAPAVTVESKGTMAHMNNWKDTEATTYTAGLVGQINGLALTFDETTGECNEIDEIKVTIEGSDKVGYAYKVYKVDDTTYQFRAILLDAPKTGTTALKYTFHVKLSNGSTVTCSDETTAKAIFDTAYAKYQAANP